MIDKASLNATFTNFKHKVNFNVQFSVKFVIFAILLNAFVVSNAFLKHSFFAVFHNYRRCLSLTE